MQHLLGRARRDADRVREYVLEHLRDEDAVLVVDETGDVKKAPTPSPSSAITPAPPGGVLGPTFPASGKDRGGLGLRGRSGQLGLPKHSTEAGYSTQMGRVGLAGAVRARGEAAAGLVGRSGL
jgi:hypothetical protein